MFITEAFAQTAAPGAAGGGADILMSILPFLLIFVVMYFLIIRPQRAAMKRRDELLKNIRRGDQVVTGGGIVGKVTKVEDQHVEIELAPNVRVRAVKATLTDITPLGGGKPAND